jgi:hypothetical protein
VAPPNPQHIVLLHRLRRILEAAAECGIDIAPIKGAHLLTSVYGRDEDRGPMADVDFLVRPGDWDRARQMMVELGFAARAMGRWLPEEPSSHEAGFNLELADGRKILIEVHRYLFDPSRLPIDHDALWSRSVASTLDDAPCRRLAAEDHFVHLVLHATVHRLMQLERTVTDLELLLLRRGGIDLEIVVARAHEWRARHATWLFLSLLAERAQESGCSAAGKKLAPSAPVRKLLRWVVPDASGHRFGHLHHRLQAAIMWPLLFDSPLDVLRLVGGHPTVQWVRGRRPAEGRDDAG